MGKREISLFTGAGGGLLGGHLLGWEPVAFVEYEAYPQKVLKARIADGSLPDVPVFGDIHDFDGTKWKGRVDVLSGGFPCQPFSVAGKRAAVDDSRNMWPETIRVLRECEAPEGFFENVPGLLTGGHGYFGTILKDLDDAGYSAVWDCVGGAAVGAPHRRDRLWIYVWKAPDWTPKGLSPQADLEDDEWWPCDRVADLLRELGQQEPVTGSWSRAGILHRGVAYHLAPSSSGSGKTVDGGWPSSMLNIMTKPEIPAFWQPYPTPLADEPRRPVGLTDEERYIFSTPTCFDGVGAKRQEILDREHDDVRPGRTKPNNLRDQVQVEEGLRTWPTPRSQDSKHGGATEWELSQAENYDLLHTAVARMDGDRESFPTPTVQDSKNDGGPGQFDRHSPGLNTLVKMGGGRGETWPTPKVAANRASRGSMVENQQWSAPGLEQAVELSEGVLPREFNDEGELKGASRERYKVGLKRTRQEWPTPLAGNVDAATGGNHGGMALRKAVTGDDECRETWPTPRATKTSREDPETWGRRAAQGKVHTPPLALAVEMAERHHFPTPTAQPFGTMSSGYRDADNPGVKKESLDTMARRDTWPDAEREVFGLPMTQDARIGPGNIGGNRHRVERGSISLADAILFPEGIGEPSREERSDWPTPTASTNRKSTRAMTASKDNGRRSGGGQSSPPALEQAVELAEGIIPKELEGIPFEDLPEATRDMFPTTATERSGINPNTGKGAGLSKTITSEERGVWPTPRAAGMVGGSSIYKKAEALLRSGDITQEEATAMFDGIGRDAGEWPDQEVRQEYPTPRTANASMTAESDETLFARGRTGEDCLANVAQRLDEVELDQELSTTIQREEWRTPSTMDAYGEFVREGKKLTGRRPSDPQVNLADQVAASERQEYPSPRVSTGGRAGGSASRKEVDAIKRGDSVKHPFLADTVMAVEETERQEYPTPSAMDGARVGKAVDPDAWLDSRDKHAERGVNKHYSLDVAIHFIEQGRDPKDRQEWPSPSASRSGENEDFLDRLVTKDGDPAVRGERAYNPGAKHHAQLTLDRVVKLPSERDTFPTPAPGTHGRGAHAHKGVVNALLRDEKPEVQSLTVDIVMAGELRKVGVREVVTFRTGEVIMHDGSTRYITVDIQEDRKTRPTTTASDARGSRRSTAATDEWTSNPGTTLLDATLEADGEGTDGWQEDLKKKNPPPQLSPDWVEWLMGWPLGWTRVDNGTDPEGLEAWRVESSMNRWWWKEPEGLARVTREKKDRVSRLKALGNGQVPLSAAAAWLLLESTARAAEAGEAEINDLVGLFGMG